MRVPSEILSVNVDASQCFDQKRASYADHVGSGVEESLRELAPQVLGALVRRYGHFDAAEDAVQEALLAAAMQWPADGVPDDPKAWLIRVASRRLIDHMRRERRRTGGRCCG